MFSMLIISKKKFHSLKVNKNNTILQKRIIKKNIFRDTDHEYKKGKSKLNNTL